MTLSDILTFDRTFCGVEVSSKKRVLEQISANIANSACDMDAEDIFTHLIARERLGSTGIGHGVAIPHSRVTTCNDTIGALFQLKNKIDFDAIDNQPVDLIFVLLIPEQDTDQVNNRHLAVLSLLAELFSQATLREKLRQVTSHQALYDTIMEYSKQIS